MDEPTQDGTADAPERIEDSADERLWIDPRTGMEWHVRAIRGRNPGDAAGSPATLVFTGRGGRHWVGYCGDNDLAHMDDIDLILLVDCTVAAAS